MFYLARRKPVLVAFFALTLAVPAMAGAGVAAGAPPRSQVLLDGWLFQPDPLGVGDTSLGAAGLRPDGLAPVAVPKAWDEYNGVMDGYEGVGWYAYRSRPIASARVRGSACASGAPTTARRSGSTASGRART